MMKITGISQSSTKAISSYLVAAKNMTSLRRAYVRGDPLGTHIIASLGSYPLLTELGVHGVKPQKHISPQPSTFLTKITWMLPATHLISIPSNPKSAPLSNLFGLIEATCPLLQSLDVGYVGHHIQIVPRCPTSVLPEYRMPESREIRKASLPHLRHFGFKDRVTQRVRAIRAGAIESRYFHILLDFIKIHRHSLTSLSLPINIHKHRQADLDIVLRLCERLPKLTKISWTDR
jgi:hypothetical protein